MMGWCKGQKVYQFLCKNRVLRSQNQNGTIIALQVMVGIESSTTVYKGADVNEDGWIGLEEVIYILQKVSGLR